MKFFYDKLLLLLAVLALLGGVTFYVINSSAASSNGAVLQLASNPYQTVPIPDPAVKSANWPEPGPQSSGKDWLYDIFTPPKIYIDAEGNFTAVPPKIIGKPDPFGIYLSSISREPYRLQIQGFSGNRKKPEECVLFFFDLERQIRFFIRPGEVNSEAEVELLKFAIDREIDVSNVKVTATATILDKRTGEKIKIVDGETLYEKEISLVFLSKEDPSVRVEMSIATLPEGGKYFETANGQYTLKEINLEAGSVIVEKSATEDFGPETLELIAMTLDQPSEDAGIDGEASEPAVEEADFNSIFN